MRFDDVRSRGVRGASRVVESLVPFLEPLESRRMMAATLSGGTLKITGGAADDAIVISINPDDATKLDVYTCSAPQTFSIAAITKGIKIKTGDGEDRVEVDDANGAVNIPMKIDGGAGDDELHGGAAADVINGGRGDDDLFGHDGADRITGSRGEDVFQSTDNPAEFQDLGEADGVRVELDEAPAAVQAAVLSLLNGEDFENLLRESDEGETVFELEWEVAGVPHSAKIDNDGNVIEEEVEIDPDTLPQAVKDAVAAAYPDGTITEAETLEIPEGSFFEVEVQVKNRFRELRITPGGQIVDDELQPKE